MNLIVTIKNTLLKVEIVKDKIKMEEKDMHMKKNIIELVITKKKIKAVAVQINEN